MYPIALTTPMSKDLTDFGFESLPNADAVTNLMENREGNCTGSH
jgi:hypothetical protein